MNYPDLESLSPELKAILAGKREANVYKMLMHSPNWRRGSRPWPTRRCGARRGRRRRELAIVRVGRLYNSPYEVHQHEQIGRLMGLSDAQLAACALGADQGRCRTMSARSCA